jgi:oligopeptide/dipeptide ABC transporter ATP-binding protein
MYLGKIVELAEKNDIYNRPLHPYTRMLLSAVPSCDPQKKKRIIAIKGEANLVSVTGCNFQNRCPYKSDICIEQEPFLGKVENNRFCACHFAGSI